MNVSTIRPLIIMIAAMAGWLGFEIGPEQIHQASLIVSNLIMAVVAAWAFVDNLRKDARAKPPADSE